MSEKKPYTGSMLSGCMDFSEAQPTDEAAVEQRHRDFARKFWLSTTEKAIIAKALARFEAEAIAAERQRAEQAEQKLADAVKVLRPFASHVDKRGETITLQWGNSTYTGTLKPEHFYAASDFLATIRSAASGEVGE